VHCWQSNMDIPLAAPVGVAITAASSGRSSEIASHAARALLGMDIYKRMDALCGDGRLRSSGRKALQGMATSSLYDRQ
jgi:hypothetical protein